MKASLALSFLLVAGLAHAQNAAPVPAAKAGAGETPLIPRDVLFGNPERGPAQISPDGSKIAFLAPVNGVMNVWVGPADNLADAKPVTNDTKRGIRQYFWAHTNQHVLYLQDDGGDENWRVYAVDLASKTTKDLTPFDSIKGPDGQPIKLPSGKLLRPAARIDGVSENFPNEILIGLNNRNPMFHDVHRVNITTGELKLVYQNDKFASVVADDTFKPRLASDFTEDGGVQWYTFDADLKTKEFIKVGVDDSLTTSPVGFDKSGQVLFLVDSRDRVTAGLFAYDLKSGQKTLLAENAKCDVGGSLIHPTQKNVQAVEFDYLKPEWTVLDKSIQGDLDYLKTVHAGEVNIASRSFDDKRWIVTFTTDNGPAYFYRYDRGAAGKPGKAAFLYTTRPALEKVTLAHNTPSVIKARDGLELVSYLTLPAWLDKDNNGRPDAGPLPMVLLVHGGPWARDSWGYDGNAQWLANRGYAVLQVNYRGSTGFGKNHLNAGNKEWAGKMHDDLLDAVAWAVDNKIAAKDKVAIMGGSYGGYATLVGLTFTPDTFACGVDIVGPSNIATLLSTIPPYWAPMVEVFKKRVGDHTTDEGRKFLDSRSPLTFVDKIKKPLLIGQGANDPRVKQSEADQIVSAMQGKNIPVTYVLFPDEGHGFARPENRTAFNAVTEQFLAKHLGGRAEAENGSIAKSTAQIKVGAQFVPNLPAPASK